MEASVVFTPSQLIALCSAVITLSGAATIVANLIMKVTAPNKVQNARLDSIEVRLKEHDEYFKKDLRRFEALEDGNRITQRALLALLAHGIDGNEIDSLKRAKDELQEYLLRR